MRVSVGLPLGLPALTIHWSWLLGAVAYAWLLRGSYSSVYLAIADYAALSLLALLHQVGRTIAARRIGVPLRDARFDLLAQVPGPENATDQMMLERMRPDLAWLSPDSWMGTALSSIAIALSMLGTIQPPPRHSIRMIPLDSRTGSWTTLNPL